MRGVAPLFVALAANAPFIAGRDSGLATVRPTLADALPRQGVGPRFQSWADIEGYIGWGRRSGAFADVGQLWWECRPNFRLGTIELRAADAQMSLADVHAIAALAHATVAELCDRYDDGGSLEAFDTEMIQENRWRAARFGLAGDLVDLRRTRMVPARTLIRSLIRRGKGSRLQASVTEGLRLATARAERDVPAEQRAIVAGQGMQELMRWAADATELSPGVRLRAAG
jgi:carboxylate-amine ligase